MATPASQTLDKALVLFKAILADDGQSPLRVLADVAGLPFSTAYRLAVTLERQGMIQKERRGRYIAGPSMMAAARQIDESRLIARLSRPALAKLARRLKQTVHLGVLEDGMVTYLVKETYGPAAIFTQEGMQLEAYCSGIGKVLLAHLDEDGRERYLSDGPFIALTSNTIIAPAQLRDHLKGVKIQGWAVDDAEVFETLKCVATPILRTDGSVVAAISVSAPAPLSTKIYREACLAALRDTAEEIRNRLALPTIGVEKHDRITDTHRRNPG